MLETARGSFNLKDLEAGLQHHLREKWGKTFPLEVSCLLRDNNLLIFVQSPESGLSPQEVFSELRSILPQQSIPDHFSVQLLLIVQDGQSFQQALDADFNVTTPLLLPGDPVSPTNYSFKGLVSRFSRQGLPLTAGMTGVILGLGCLYAVSRPCVIGECKLIGKAQIDAQSALMALESNNPDLMTVKTYLSKATEQLNSIPSWSSYYEQATAAASLYQTRLDHIDLVLQALEKGKKATIQGQKPPLDVTQWQSIQGLWKEAIASLSQVPSQSPFYPLAQTKLKDDQGQLILVENRLKAEQQGVIKLNYAKEASKIALARQNSAQSFTDWQLVQETWQSAIDRLQEITPGTTVYEQRERLLENYFSQMLRASVRKRQEESALKYYNQAIESAKLAENAQNKQQWSTAVSDWIKAINTLKLIPNNAFQYSQAQPLIMSYNLALTEAEKNRKIALRLAEIRQDLDQTCSGNDKICTYKITDNTIKVTLTKEYMQRVWQTALQAKASSNVYTQIELLNHISRLEQTWQTISNRARKRIDIYNPEGKLMVSYDPQ